ncbi:MAG: hypothetical protein J0G94_09930, partial [Sphingomonadales bacterium]|nr:hypothetical protein [Sphingomonadales bacterium]
MRSCLLPLGATLALLATTPASAQEAAPAGGKVWPASAEKVDYAALQTLPDWRGIWAPMMGRGPKPEI